MRNRHTLFVWIAAFSVAAVAFGCSKKAEEPTSLSSLDQATGTEELAQLPQSSTANQQAAVEVLPIETSPVTQAAPSLHTLGDAASSLSASGDGSLSYQQKIQTALKNAGLYSGTVDGKIGPNTRKAIEAFQKQNNLKVDGKVGPKTWALLEPYFLGQAQQSVETAQQ